MVVLVVEDEPLVRAVAVDALEDAGFEVLEAATADYAVAVLGQRSDIRVLFTDVEMPGQLNGFQLARFALEHYQRVRDLLAPADHALGREIWHRIRFSCRRHTAYQVW